ncbi:MULTISPECIES: CBS domain-containing protein [Streptomyces]|nr:CBS domain-containing protein [Streptomyces nigrescens]MEE4418275.1 CBS domain-containing protein [Streptomyces sp. DSM 41528]
MTDEVVSARSGTPVVDVARRLAEYGIDGLPVVDADDRVIGVVSATDLQGDRRAAAADGMPTAGEVMSVPARTVRADDSVVRAARLMSESGVERLPVVDEEARLVGMVTRRDVLQVFVRTDAEIRDEVVDEIVVRSLWLSPQSVDVAVHDGLVILSGRLENSGTAALAVRMTRQVDGVTAVVDRLTYRKEAPHRDLA